jgi:hypothetical protein
MMLRTRTLPAAVAVALTVLATGPASAQAPSVEDPSAGGEPAWVATTAEGLDPQVAAQTAAQLQGVLVENEQGTIIGKLSDVVRDRSNRLLGVIQPGDLDNWDGSGMTLPMSGFYAKSGHLRAGTDVTAQEVAEAREVPAMDYAPVPKHVRLGNLGEGRMLEDLPEPDAEPRPFSDLDLDHDGVLSSSEALNSPDIGTDWPKYDTNNDGVLDRSEVRPLYGDAPPTAENVRR